MNKYVSQKAYEIVDADGVYQNISAKKIKVFVDDRESKAEITDLFIKSEYRNGLVGWSILETLREEDNSFSFQGRKLTFKCVEDGILYQIKSIKNPLVQMNDKDLEQEWVDKITELLLAEDTVFNDEIEKLEEEISSSEEEKVESVPNSFERESQSFIDRGFEIIESGEFRLMLKSGAVPILCKIVSPDHYEEYDYFEMNGDKTYVFKDFAGKKIEFTID